nr:SUMF1/EgtB/PvdO family nonheme iron enzyme [Glycomyces tenuis]
MTGEADMVRIDGGTVRMGSEDFYPEEGPVIERQVDSFLMARHAVTNRQFAEFVEATGYTTVAERPLAPADFPGVDPEMLQPGSLVFTPTRGPVDLRDWRQWWRWEPGASWRHPHGPGSGVDGLEDHPVVQVAFEDASAYAAWAGMRLPSEAEWEWAARGGLLGATYAWGEEPNDGTRANSWQGDFPYRNTGAKGWKGTSPVGSFPPNGYGLYDMTGNTWEWTGDYWSARHRVTTCQCSPGESGRAAGTGSGERRPQRVLKGGSHLCAPEYCLRYRPAARSPETEDSATTHLGFRLARDLSLGSGVLGSPAGERPGRNARRGRASSRGGEIGADDSRSERCIVTWKRATASSLDRRIVWPGRAQRRYWTWHASPESPPPRSPRSFAVPTG